MQKLFFLQFVLVLCLGIILSLYFLVRVFVLGLREATSFCVFFSWLPFEALLLVLIHFQLVLMENYMIYKWKYSLLFISNIYTVYSLVSLRMVFAIVLGSCLH